MVFALLGAIAWAGARRVQPPAAIAGVDTYNEEYGLACASGSSVPDVVLRTIVVDGRPGGRR